MFSAIICGRPGIGKSWTMLELAHILDRDVDDVPRFSVDRVCFSATQFSELLSRDDLPAGSVICLDDAGLSLYSKETLGRVAVELGKIFQSMRYKNLIVLMTLPQFGMLEAHVRKLASAYLEITGKDDKRKLRFAKFQVLQTNPFSGNPYRHNYTKLIIRTHPDLGIPIRQHVSVPLAINIPPKKLRVAYEAKKKKYMDRWNKDAHERLMDLEQAVAPGGSKHRQGLNFAEAVEYVKDNWRKFYVPIKKGGELIQGFSSSEIAKDVDEKGDQRFNLVLSMRLKKELETMYMQKVLE